MFELLIALAALVQAPATATAPAEVPRAPPASVTFGDAGGWNVQRRHDGCFMMANYEGDGATSFAFFMNRDGTQMVIFANERRPASQESRRDFRLEFPGASNWRDLAGD